MENLELLKFIPMKGDTEDEFMKAINDCLATKGYTLDDLLSDKILDHVKEPKKKAPMHDVAETMVKLYKSGEDFMYAGEYVKTEQDLINALLDLTKYGDEASREDEIRRLKKEVEALKDELNAATTKLEKTSTPEPSISEHDYDKLQLENEQLKLIIQLIDKKLQSNPSHWSTVPNSLKDMKVPEDMLYLEYEQLIELAEIITGRRKPEKYLYAD